MLPLAQSVKVYENRNMMSKIRKLFSKFSKNHKVDVVDQEIGQNDVSDNTSEIQVKTSDDQESQEYDLDLNQDLTWKDKLESKLEHLKDFFNKIHFNRFKSFNIKESNESNNFIQRFSKRLNINLGPLDEKINNLDLSKLHLEIFSAKRRTNFNKAFLLSVVLIATYLVGSTIGKILSSSTQSRVANGISLLELDYSKELNKNMIVGIKDANIFKTQSTEVENTEVKPIKELDLICKEATKNSTLPIKLINTIVLQDTVKSIASVQVRNSELLNFREGDKIDNIAQIGKIDRLGLVIKNLRDGSCEKVESKDMSPRKKANITVLNPKQSKEFKKNLKKVDGIENDGNNFTIKKSLLDEKMADISNVLTQARGIQITNPDGSLSFKIVDIEPGGIFSHLGIQDNDIITNINGSKINDLNEVMNLFSKITTIDQLKLTVIRGGSEVPLEYKFQ